MKLGIVSEFDKLPTLMIFLRIVRKILKIEDMLNLRLTNNTNPLETVSTFLFSIDCNISTSSCSSKIPMKCFGQILKSLHLKVLDTLFIHTLKNILLLDLFHLFPIQFLNDRLRYLVLKGMLFYLCSFQHCIVLKSLILFCFILVHIILTLLQLQIDLGD